ncbi:MFS transporter [Lentzea tibetensis]|uniref:MFS transporter n=2 Tax=Lentzea tibetensis TaxID=2591470 RepID=A0A563F365_9PSEU|nr:MFS transporter [Lentzea tibetensis]
MPFGSLFLTTEVGVSPLALGTFMLITPVASVVASTVVGRLSDTRMQRRTLMVIGGLAGAAGAALFAVLRDYWFLLGASATFVAVASSLMPMIFAYARGLERSGPFVISSLRTLFSVAWVAGPPVAALLVATWGFTGLYVSTAVLYVVVAGLSLLLPSTVAVEAAPQDDAPVRGQRIPQVVAAFVLLQGATGLAVSGLPLFVTTELHGTAGDAGLVLGLCAALEIPLMLWLGALATRKDLHLIVLAGAAVAITYHATMLTTTGIWQVAGAQLLHAAAISAVMGVGISYFQSLEPTRPGHASTLFSNTATAGGMLAGPLLGVAQAVGFRYTYAISLTMCVLGVTLLAFVRRPR